MKSTRTSLETYSESVVEDLKAIKRLTREQGYSLVDIIRGVIRSFRYDLELEKAYYEYRQSVNDTYPEDDNLPF